MGLIDRLLGDERRRQKIKTFLAQHPRWESLTFRIYGRMIADQAAVRQGGDGAVGLLPDLSDDADEVLKSPFFDAEHYARNAALEFENDRDAAAHYARTGEMNGIPPSKYFDPVFYRDTHADLAEFDGNLLLHFTKFGNREGRISARERYARSRLGRQRFDPDRETCLVCIHEAEFTGAPILGANLVRHLSRRFNVVAVCFRDGVLVDDLRKHSHLVAYPDVGRLGGMERDAAIDTLFGPLHEEFRFAFAFANSVETEVAAASCQRLGIPVVSLVHEFAEYTMPLAKMETVLNESHLVVFSSGLTEQSARMSCRATADFRNQIVLPQGKSVVPVGSHLKSDARPRDNTIGDYENKFLVVGCGYVQPRKGLDLFLAGAASAVRTLGGETVRFLWIGDGYTTVAKGGDFVWLEDQIRRSGLSDLFRIHPALDSYDLERVYRQAGAMFLSSRLDPFPNVAIDAFHAGLPVVCFDQASGVADYFTHDPDLRSLVVPYLDATAAGQVLAALATDQDYRSRISGRLLDIAKRDFDFPTYVDRLLALAERARRIRDQEQQDALVLQRHRLPDENLIGGAIGGAVDQDDLAVRYVRFCAAGTIGEAKQMRRPVSGFSPPIYAETMPADEAFPNALAAWARAGKPKGRWTFDVVDLSDRKVPAAPSRLKVALHLHLHYPEMADDIIRRLDVNRTRPDLLISTTSSEKVRDLEQRFKGVPNVAAIRLVPNRGRDVASFYVEFGEALRAYDLVGHLHGKRSLHVDSQAHAVDIIAVWRDFLMENLIGDQLPALDVTAALFEEDPRLGLLFPEDAHVCNWGKNYDAALELANRIGVSTAVPKNVEFPVGNMFYARPDALKPLFDAGFRYEEFPAEPVGVDGTNLHALERLTPFVAEQQGYRWACTSVPGVSR